MEHPKFVMHVNLLVRSRYLMFPYDDPIIWGTNNEYQGFHFSPETATENILVSAAGLEYLNRIEEILRKRQ